MNLTHALFPPLLILMPVAAEAGLEFCNNSDEKVSVAIGYNDEGVWTSEGWWVAAAGDCVTAVGGELPNRYYYWRATSRSYSWERDDEQYMFCTSSKVFTIAGDEDCASRGYERDPFNEIDLGEATSYTMTLNAGDSEERSAPPSDRDQPMQSSGPAPGTYGEPYTIVGIFSHCDWYDAGLGCTVLSDGWSYLATSYDNTDADLLVALDDMGTNIPVMISGDMVSYEGTEAIVTIREWERAASDPYASTRAAMQGFWTSTEDASYQLLIHGSSFEEFYGQMPQDLALMHFQDRCPGAPGDGPAFQLASRDGSEDRCVFVSKVGDTSLELFVAGTMRPLTFRLEN